jgi:hypothetical protein
MGKKKLEVRTYISHMAHMIRRVEVDAVPARGEAHIDHDSRLAGPLGEVERLARASHDVVQARVCQLAEALGFGFGPVRGVSYCESVTYQYTDVHCSAILAYPLWRFFKV